jgi:hypothetical protein
VYALVFAILTSLPYLVGAINTPVGGEYSGALVIPGGFQVDYNSHMAKMWQGSRGEWDYQLLFTHEDHPGLPGVQIFYVALGALANLTGLSFPVMYQLARFLLTIAMMPLLWAFASHFFEKPRDRWTVIFFGTALMGVGWLMFLLLPELTRQVAPIEFWLSDAYHFTGVLYMPHFSAAICLQIMALSAFLNWLQQPSIRAMMTMTMALVLDALIQPYVVLLTFPLLGSVLLCKWLMEWHKHKKLAWHDMTLLIPAALHGGIALWQYGMITAHPVWKNFSDQNITHSPEPIYYLFGYALFLLPIVVGMRRTISKIPPLHAIERGLGGEVRWLLPIFWVLWVVILLYAPTATQRRYLLGVQTPLALLAAAGWAVWLKNISLPRWRFFTLIYGALGAITPLLLLISNSTAMINTKNNPVFYTPDEVAGYAWLRENTAPDAVILTTMQRDGTGSGGRLVAMTGRRVFIGHWIETIHFEDKIAQITQFFALQTADTWHQEFLKSADIDYVWYDDYARKMGSWSPANRAYLELVFDEETLQIYQVQWSE